MNPRIWKYIADYFNERGIESALGEARRLNTRETVVSMSPDEFLKLSKKGIDPRKMERLPEGNWESIPYLHLENDAKGSTRVVGHEGRHRMQRLKDVGAEEVPVTLRSLHPVWDEENPAYATKWGEDQVPDTITSEEGDYSIKFPWKLITEEQKKKETRKLKKSSKGHSRYGRGGGTIPMDVLESKTAPRGLLGPKKRKY